MTDNDFKHLTEEFGYKNLELLKQKDAYSYEYLDSFKRFSRKKNVFTALWKMEQLVTIVKN